MFWLIAGLMLLWAPLAAAQATPAALPTDAQQVQNLIQQSGCQYEITAASQTIANLQKRVNELERQLKDPPRKK